MLTTHLTLDLPAVCNRCRCNLTTFSYQQNIHWHYIHVLSGLQTRDFAYFEETSCAIQRRSERQPLYSIRQTLLAFHHQLLSTVILLLLDIYFQESVFTTELFNSLLYHHDAFTFRWTTSRSWSTDVDPHLALRLNSASISCWYDHSLSSLISPLGHQCSSFTTTSTISPSTSVADLVS